jgi:hypothetical protein
MTCIRKNRIISETSQPVSQPVWARTSKDEQTRLDELQRLREKAVVDRRFETDVAQVPTPIPSLSLPEI